MAGHQLTANQTGLYEIAIPANAATGIDIETTTYYTATNLTITHHNGDSPIYFSTATTNIEPGDTNTQMLMPSTWADINVWTQNEQLTLTLVSNNDAVVSVART